MQLFKVSFVCLFLIAFIGGCKSKKPSLAGDEPIDVTDFVDFFPTTALPFQVGDTTLLRKEKDSLLISNKVFTQFIPDSILVKLFGKGSKPKIYPLGKAKGEKETYLFVKAIAAEKRISILLGLDKKQEFIAAMPLLQLDQNAATTQTSTVDKGYSITKTVSRKNKDGSVSEGKDVYVMNNEAKTFTLIMTDALDDNITELINPIDTFPRKQKFTADYGNGKLNFVSFRDGRKTDRLNFFMHFEKNNGECTGELKGEAILTGTNTAEYREGGDPCSLQFRFTATSVTVKELEGCGSRRGLRCSFDALYPRKKETKPKITKAKATARK